MIIFLLLLYEVISDLILANSSGVLILRNALLGQQNLRISSSLTYLTGIESKKSLTW